MLSQPTNEDTFLQTIKHSEIIAHKFGYSLSHHEFVRKNSEPPNTIIQLNTQINPLEINSKRK